MTTRQFRIKPVLKILILIPFSVSLLTGINSCAGSKKASLTQKEVTPMPSQPLPDIPPTIFQKEEIPSEVFVVVEEMPKFPGGDEELLKFIASNIEYPTFAKENNIQGKIIARFIVGTDGTVSNAEILHKVDPLLDAEALRVINLLPKWQPGKQGGKPVNVWYAIPINFHLNLLPRRICRNQIFQVMAGCEIYTSMTVCKIHRENC